MEERKNKTKPLDAVFHLAASSLDNLNRGVSRKQLPLSPIARIGFRARPDDRKGCTADTRANERPQEATVKDVLRATGASFSLQQCVAPDLP
jgi:hypothetical protein